MDQKKIVLIEDDEFIREMYETEIGAAGFKVSAFGTGKEGLAAIRSETFDLLLLDIMLPDTNGLDILKMIKADEKTKGLKVVLLTNLGQDSVMKEGFSLGADGYLVKVSYNPDQVVAEVKNFLKE
jgi:DNA-binding response OmpR family regulator